LPSASFRFHLAMDTLAVRLTVPLAGPVEDLHLQVGAPCRAHKIKAGWAYAHPAFLFLSFGWPNLETLQKTINFPTYQSFQSLITSMDE